MSLSCYDMDAWKNPKQSETKVSMNFFFISTWNESFITLVYCYTSLWLYLTPVLLQGTLESWPVGRWVPTLKWNVHQKNSICQISSFVNIAQHELVGTIVQSANPQKDNIRQSSLLWSTSHCVHNLSDNAGRINEFS